MAHDVFISYSQSDKPAADAACATLEGTGIRCWIAPRDVSPGAEWGAALIEAIDDCAVVVLIFSSNANASGQVHREVEHAVSAGKTIMPVRIESAVPARSLAYYMAGLHWLDALTPPLEDHLQRLAVSIKALLKAAPRAYAGGPPLDLAPPATGSTTASGGGEERAGDLPHQTRPEAQPESPRARATIVPPRKHRFGGPIALLVAAVAVLVLVFFGAWSGVFRDLVAGSVHVVLSRTLTGHTNQVQSLVFSPDSRSLVSGSLDKTIRLWDLASGETRRTIEVGGPVFAVAFSPDGKLLASASRDNTIRIWDVANGGTPRTIDAAEPVWSVAFSPDGRSLASATNTSIKLWDVQSAQLTHTLPGAVGNIAFSPDGRTLAGTGNTIEVWDASSGQQLFALGGPSQYLRCIAFSPDSRTLASSVEDSVELWDVKSGQLSRALTGHSEKVRCVAFSPDGRELASGGWDNTLRLWDTTNYQQVVSLAAHTARIVSLAYSPDGRTIASGGADDRIDLWSVSP